MGLLRHSDHSEGEYITHFHVGHGHGWAVLAWDLRCQGPRDVMVLRSEEGFALESADPGDDPQQTLVYRGVERQAKVMDADLTSETTYYYSLFSLDDDGFWHAEVRTTLTPRSDAHWKRAGVEDEGDSLRKWARLNLAIAMLRQDSPG